MTWMALTYPSLPCEEVSAVREAAHLPGLSAEDLTSQSVIACGSTLSSSLACSEEVTFFMKVSSGPFLPRVSASHQASPPYRTGAGGGRLLMMGL